MDKYIIELEKGVWVAPWDGDPGRTIVRKNALGFVTKQLAEIVLEKTKERNPNRKFPNAKVVAI